jgi:hypothetical protein
MIQRQGDFGFCPNEKDRELLKEQIPLSLSRVAGVRCRPPMSLPGSIPAQSGQMLAWRA